MSRGNIRFDMEWVLRYLDALEGYIKQEQTLMARGAVQRIRETFETYGRTGREGLFQSLIYMENNPTSEESLKIVQQLKEEIRSALKTL
ncbi:hypothetical protein EXS74_02570 [Candidatus Woesearchaeota archaeon]|nr:hypothetical protein [Candidatus Woesearchaeota archaeon]